MCIYLLPADHRGQQEKIRMILGKKSTKLFNMLISDLTSAYHSRNFPCKLTTKSNFDELEL